MLAIFGSTEERQDLPEGDVEVQHTQAADAALQKWVVPKILDATLNGREEARQMVQAPGIHPREHHQKHADLKGKKGEAHHPKTAAEPSAPRLHGRCGRWFLLRCGIRR